MSNGTPHGGKRKRALIGDLPKGVSVFKDASGKRNDGTKKIGYRVRLGKKFTGGKPKSAFVSDLEEAREWIAAQRPHLRVMQATQLSPSDISEAIAALNQIKQRGSTLGLLDAVTLALRYHDPEGGRRLISAVATEMQGRAKARGAKDTSLRQMKSLLKSFEEAFGERLVPTISTTEIEEWLEDKAWSPRTKNNYLAQATQLFGFAIRRRYVNLNPCDPIEPMIEDEALPEILLAQDMRKLLTTAVERMPEMVGFLALSAFGWLRRSEICQLPVKAWLRTERTIRVDAEIAKTRSNRFIPVNDTLHAWLTSLELPEEGGFTHSKNPDVVGDRLLKLATMAGIEIPRNALRHSSISYALASAPFQDGKALANSGGEIAKYAGNSEPVIVKAYRHPLDAKVAAGWWELLPLKK